MALPRILLLLLAGLGATPIVSAAPPLSPTDQSRGIGIEFAGVDVSTQINDVESQANGVLAGVYGYVQQGAEFRAEGRLLAGTLDSDIGVPRDSVSVTLVDVQATLGAATADDVRLYGGIGLEHLSGDSPYGTGDGESWSVYLPVGVSRADEFSQNWRVLVSVEARFLLTGREEIDGIPMIGNAEFDRDGGLGVGASAQFRNATAGIDIEPWVQVTSSAASDTESVGGTDVQLDDSETASGGVRFTWAF